MKLKIFVPKEIRVRFWEEVVKNQSIITVIERYYTAYYKGHFPASNNEWKVESIRGDGWFDLVSGQGRDKSRRREKIGRKKLCDIIRYYSGDAETRDQNNRYCYDILRGLYTLTWNDVLFSERPNETNTRNIPQQEAS